MSVFLLQNLKTSKVIDLLTVNKVISKVKNSQYNIKYQPLDDNIKKKLFTDTAFANHDDGGSQSRNLIFLADEHCNINLLQWQSKQIKWVVHSSLAAETLAMSDGVDSTVYISVL